MSLDASTNTRNVGDFGLLYLAFGAPYLAMALASAKSARVFNPSAPICIVTDVCELEPAPSWWDSTLDVFKLVPSDAFESGYAPKTRMLQYTPFEKTLFLDCDTLILGDLSLARTFLSHFDLLLRHTDRPGQDHRRVLLGGTLPYNEIGHFNSGVFGFRKSARMDAFFAQWGQSYQQIPGKRDQASLLEAIYLSDVKVMPLQDRWNAGQDLRESQLRDQIIVWHYKTRLDRQTESLVRSAASEAGLSKEHFSVLDTYLKNRRHWRQRTKSGIISTCKDVFRGSLTAKITNRFSNESA